MERRKNLIIITIGITVVLLILSQFAKAQGSLEVTFEALPNSKGQVIFMLFNQEDGFPNEQESALEVKTVQVKNNIANCTFSELAYGEYALCAIHDKNKNGVLDKNWMNIPKENVGISGEQRGKPSYEDAVVILSASADIRVTMTPFNPYKK